ncbi:nitroreductase family protein [Clostridium vincentii]|uniref:Coenzyme F420:L-glutamate ligase n=1 Tax=Clostridium vincentii TaxID=52704 RepID=A0A2T0BEM2_9CLOT|nr:nitroreductase family protein [Clostridium vincentii]PRR82334.1 Coenzyme F420:L-glutamate ligase [Clostridium vincentii]
MNDILNNIIARRSIRSYSTKQIPDVSLADLINAGIYAPSGGNSQSRIFTVLQKTNLLEDLNEAVKEAFLNMNVDKMTYKSKISGKQASIDPRYSFYYYAPTLIIVSNDRKYSNAMADCSVALENIFLVAHSLDLGSCWINQLAWFCDEPKVRMILTELGIPKNYIVCGSASIGYSSGNIPHARSKKEGTVDIIK